MTDDKEFHKKIHLVGEDIHDLLRWHTDSIRDGGAKAAVISFGITIAVEMLCKVEPKIGPATLQVMEMSKSTAPLDLKTA